MLEYKDPRAQPPIIEPDPEGSWLGWAILWALAVILAVAFWSVL